MCGIVGTVGPGSGRRGRSAADVRRHPRIGAPTTGAPSSRAASASACAGSASSTWPAATSRSRNEDGSVLVVFNGEIYNHEALHRRAGGRRATSSGPGRDTEVLVHLYEDARRADGRSGCAACSPSPSGTGAAAGCCSRATTSGRSRCSTPSRAAGSRSPPRSRRCWRTIPSLAPAVAVRARPVSHPAVRAGAGHLLRAHPRAAARALHGLGGRHHRGSSATGT